MASTEKTIKITNKPQFERLIEIMEENVDVARGLKFAGGFNVTREKYDVVWKEITTSLNSLGNPTRSTAAWQKVWSDLKLKIRKKLDHNKKEKSSNDGETICKLQYLTPVEERVVNLLNIDKAVRPKWEQDLLPPDEIGPGPSRCEPDTKRNIKEIGEQRTNGLTDQTKYLKNIAEHTRAMAENIKKIYEIKEEKLKLYKEFEMKKEERQTEELKLQFELVEYKRRKLELLQNQSLFIPEIKRE